MLEISHEQSRFFKKRVRYFSYVISVYQLFSKSIFFKLHIYQSIDGAVCCSFCITKRNKQEMKEMKTANYRDIRLDKISVKFSVHFILRVVYSNEVVTYCITFRHTVLASSAKLMPQVFTVGLRQIINNAIYIGYFTNVSRWYTTHA